MASLPTTCSQKTTTSMEHLWRSRPRPLPTLPSKLLALVTRSRTSSPVTSRASGPTASMVWLSPRPGPPLTSYATKLRSTIRLQMVWRLILPLPWHPRRAPRLLFSLPCTSSLDSTPALLSTCSRSGLFVCFLRPLWTHTITKGTHFHCRHRCWTWRFPPWCRGCLQCHWGQHLPLRRCPRL